MNCAALVVALEGGFEVDEGFVEEVLNGLGVGVDEAAAGADVEVELIVEVAGAGVLLAGAC